MLNPTARRIGVWLLAAIGGLRLLSVVLVWSALWVGQTRHPPVLAPAHANVLLVAGATSLLVGILEIVFSRLLAKRSSFFLREYVGRDISKRTVWRGLHQASEPWVRTILEKLQALG